MKTNNKNDISILLISCAFICISVFGILILDNINSRIAPIDQIELEEEKIIEKKSLVTTDGSFLT